MAIPVVVKPLYYSLSICPPVGLKDDVAGVIAVVALEAARKIGHHTAEAKVTFDRDLKFQYVVLESLIPGIGSEVTVGAVQAAVQDALRDR